LKITFLEQHRLGMMGNAFSHSYLSMNQFRSLLTSKTSWLKAGTFGGFRDLMGETKKVERGILGHRLPEGRQT
jgi:hypothetical protein